MSTPIGRLAVMLSANTSQFRSGMQQAAASTRSFSMSASSNLSAIPAALGKIALAAGGLATAFLSVRGVISSVRSELQRFDEVAKLAARIGDSTEAISRLQFAGEQTGASTETLNKSLESMTRRVSEAATGTGEAKDALEQLGLAASDVKQLAPTEAFKLIAERLKTVQTQADKVRIVYDIFGRSGMDLVNTLNLGAKGLEEMAKRSDQLGNTIDSKAAKSAEAFNDALNELKRALGGVAGQLIKSLIPSLKRLVDGLTFAAIQVNKLTSAFASLFNGEWMGDWKMVDEFRRVGEAADQSAGMVGKFRMSLQDLSDEAQKQQATFDQLDSQGGGFATWANRIEFAVGQIAAKFVDVTASFREAESAAQRIFDATRTPIEKMQQRLAEVGELFKAGFLDEDTMMRAIRQIRGEQAMQVQAATNMDLSPQRVSFAAIGAEAAAGRGQDRLERNTADEVKESRKQTKALAELLRIGKNSQGAAITVVNY